MKLLIMYHSGVGNTRLIAELLYRGLGRTNEVDMYPIEAIDGEFPYQKYDGYIIGFPTYHAHPSRSIINFIDHMKELSNRKPAYIFTTCGWFSANTLRVFAMICIAKNIIPVLFQSYRCSATDGVLFAPFIKSLFTFEKNLSKKIENDVEKISQLFHIDPLVNLPRFKLISIINYPNKKLGQFFSFHIYLHKKNCSKCGKCIRHCNMQALTLADDGYPLFDKLKCEKCYRCIHHCPKKALSLSRRKVPKKQLSKDFFDSYKNKIV